MAQKATAAYKMSKDAKRILALIDDKQRRGEVKRLLIESELFAEWQQKFGSRRKDKDAE